jgi:undecaprenyl-diphosphatase
MDSEILGWIAAHRTPWLDGVMWALTAAGSGGALWIAGAVATALFDRRRRMAAWQIGLAVLLAWVASDQVLKPLVQRARPDARFEASQVEAHRPSTWSFPSGHASSSAAGALMLASAWPSARVAFWLLAIGISASRLYLGVHYPTDVVAGFVIGLLVAWFVRGRTRWRFTTGGSER